MLYIVLILGLIFIIAGAWSEEETSLGVGVGIFLTTLCITLITAGVYNYRNSTIDGQLSVLEEQNQIVLAQIEPLVQQALEYESNTYKDFKLDVTKVIAFTQLYPDLKANSSLNKQIDIILANQEEIKQLKLDKASLNAYHFWLWTPKVN
jgi:ABC-type transport system involved in multi-copper enzyme maturation permease subunit